MARDGAVRPRYAKHLVVMAKRPVMGRVKRRLARESGEVAALRFYRNCLSRTVLRLARDPRWTVATREGRAAPLVPAEWEAREAPEGQAE